MFVNGKRVVNLILLSAALILAGCGGNDNPNNGDPAPVSQQTGVFVDSPVAGISYATQTLSGITNSLGEFTYLPGETVTFSIGDITFPAAAASAFVTPLDLVVTTNTNDPSVVNILRLLQTLDTDGDLSVINIEPAAVTAASGIVLDFTLATADFEIAAADFLTAAVGNPALVTQLDAVAHFEGVLAAVPLIGAWLLPDNTGTGYSILVFKDTNRYIISHTNNMEPDSVFGTVPVSAEHGIYTWDPSTGAFNVTVLGESDGAGGLSDPMGNVTLTLAGDVLTLTDSIEGPSSLSRIVPNNIIGAWVYSETRSNNDNILVFLDASRYLIAHTNNGEPDSVFGSVPVSAEHGTYTWNASTGAFSLTVIGQSDGDGGISNFTDDDTLTISTYTNGREILAALPPAGPGIGFTRIAPPENKVENDVNITESNIVGLWRRTDASKPQNAKEYLTGGTGWLGNFSTGSYRRGSEFTWSLTSTSSGFTLEEHRQFNGEINLEDIIRLTSTTMYIKRQSDNITRHFLKQ